MLCPLHRGKALLLASCDELYLIDVCAMGAVALHALRTWPTSDTVYRLGTSNSWVAGIGITGCTACAHAYKKRKDNNRDVTLHLNTFELKENFRQ